MAKYTIRKNSLKQIFFFNTYLNFFNRLQEPTLTLPDNPDNADMTKLSTP